MGIFIITNIYADSVEIIQLYAYNYAAKSLASCSEETFSSERRTFIIYCVLYEIGIGISFWEERMCFVMLRNLSRAWKINNRNIYGAQFNNIAKTLF